MTLRLVFQKKSPKSWGVTTPHNPLVDPHLVDSYPKNRKSIRYAVYCTVESITSSLHCITDTLKALCQNSLTLLFGTS